MRSSCAGLWRCRCQALLLAGDAAATDPVCSHLAATFANPMPSSPKLPPFPPQTRRCNRRGSIGPILPELAPPLARRASRIKTTQQKPGSLSNISIQKSPALTEHQSVSHSSSQQRSQRLHSHEHRRVHRHHSSRSSSGTRFCTVVWLQPSAMLPQIPLEKNGGGQTQENVRFENTISPHAQTMTIAADPFRKPL